MSDAADGQSYAATTVGTSTKGGAESAASSTGGTGSTIESALTTFLEGGLGIVPLVSGLMGLFGGCSSAPPQLEKYQQPSSIDFVSAETPSGLAAANYDQFGMPRVAETAPPTSTAADSSGASASSAADFDQFGMPQLASARPTSAPAGSLGASGPSAADYQRLGMPKLADTALPTSTAATSSEISGASAADYDQLG
ncbi:MAG: hypothetical protein WBL61_12210, partial [Bryobacteraceae bacterium]